MQALCHLDVQGDAGILETGRLEDFFREFEVDELSSATTNYARTLVETAWRGWKRFKERIASSAPGWDVSRMGIVDRNVIRAALAELCLGEVPPKVVLNEAIEIAREYASAESAGFVNGVLDELYRGIKNGEWRMENGE